ncbi:MAG: hypothetical protein ABIH88_01200 [Patescibacteria group bacterium]|nr:hypothetical protein [Patescibacteria group bacterium]
MADDNLKEKQTILEERESLEDQTPKADAYLQVVGLIKSYVVRIDKLKEEIKKEKEMFDNELDNDEVYQSHFEKAKEAARIKNETKKQLLNQPSMMEISEKIKSAKDDLKESQEMLSGYLKQFQNLSDETQIEGEDGTMMEIVSIVKLVKKSAKYNP